MKNLTEIAKAAMEEVDTEDKVMTLKEHDHIYHHDNYTGGTCLFRKTMAKGDAPEEALAKANELEGSQLAARNQEREFITDAFLDNVPMLRSEKSRAKYGATLTVSDQDDNGDVKVVITAFPVVHDEELTKERAKKIVEGAGKIYSERTRESNVRKDQGLGYKLKSFKVWTLRGNNVKNGGKKIFAITMHKDARIGMLSPESLKSLEWKMGGEEDAPMSETEKSLALKRYGLKMEDGKVKPRVSREEETPQERYLRFVNEGRTIPKNNAEVKKQREDKAKVDAEERKKNLEDMTRLGDDFFKKLGF